MKPEEVLIVLFAGGLYFFACSIFRGNTNFSVAVLRLSLFVVSRPFIPTTVYFSPPSTFRIFVSRLFVLRYHFSQLQILDILFLSCVVGLRCRCWLRRCSWSCRNYVRFQVPVASFLSIFLELRRQPLQNGRSNKGDPSTGPRKEGANKASFCLIPNKNGPLANRDR